MLKKLTDTPLVAVFLRKFISNRYTLFVAFMLFYSAALQYIGGLPSLINHFFTEAPILLGIYYSLNLLLKPGRWTPWIAALPPVMMYGAYDTFFLAYGNVFHITDFNELPELIDVLPATYKIFLAALIFTPLLLILSHIHFKKIKQAFIGVFVMGLVGFSTQYSPGPVITAFENTGEGVDESSDASSVWAKGRLAMLVYFEAKRKQTQALTVADHNRDQYVKDMLSQASALAENVNKRNTHLIVLESFLDPTLLENVSFSKDPRHPDYFARYASSQGFSIAPVFGGSSAQSEFEALCGVPAFRKLGSVEFNIFGGAPTYCLPGILSKIGYQTISSNGFKPNFFNAIKAYNGIGFQEVYFASEYTPKRKTYFSTGIIPKYEHYMFDGDLFDANIKFVKQRLQEQPAKPLFNYVLSIYGHFPHYMDPVKRPQVLSMKSTFDDKDLLLAANQHYYRTQVLSRYLTELIEADPNSLIILLSDHLPPLREGLLSYQKLRYLGNVEGSTFMNRLLVIENGKAVKYPTIHHYDVPSLIYNYLTDGKYCKDNPCNLANLKIPKEQYEKKYLRLMSHAGDEKEK